MSTLDLATIGIMFTVISAVASLTWWLSGQFNAIKSLVHTRVEATTKLILDKLEYHERHDDDRFNSIRKDISEVRLRNATKDTLMSVMMSKLDKLNGK